MVAAQEGVARARGERDMFGGVSWERDEGRHGGGTRRTLADTNVFDRASVNVSQVHYDDEPTKRLSSATALSTIIHPRHPHAPSVHVHVSWTEMRDGEGYWRIMADLNPAFPDPAATARFADALRDAAPTVFELASHQGDNYFYIPALGRHRGATHFYLEQYATEDARADAALARVVAEAAIDTHAAIVADALRTHGEYTPAERATQLAYHTVYFFQVLTLDRGTTSGLLVHDQNDVGILGSLPSHVDRNLLASWRSRVPTPVETLLDDLLAALPPGDVVLVDEHAKRALAVAVRAFYIANPRALDLQARGDVLPPTVANHR
ncbi:MAG TPA: coproporphyrinogen III oxidase, partial [Kofleriaceae bacterium]|nr:coproporphyrinogen III oxidase [Kofleriaceae bacterium]